MTRKHQVLCASLVGLIPALFTFDLPGLSSGNVVDCLLPGVILAIAAAGNIHAWPVWIAALGNFFFYFVLTWVVIVITRKLKSTSEG